MFNAFGSAGCTLKDIRAVDCVEVDAGIFEVYYYHVDDSGNATYPDGVETKIRQVDDDYCCMACGLELLWWADVLDHVTDVGDDDDGPDQDADSLGWGWAFSRA